MAAARSSGESRDGTSSLEIIIRGKSDKWYGLGRQRDPTGQAVAAVPDVAIPGQDGAAYVGYGRDEGGTGRADNNGVTDVG